MRWNPANRIRGWFQRATGQTNEPTASPPPRNTVAADSAELFRAETQQSTFSNEGAASTKIAGAKPVTRRVELQPMQAGPKIPGAKPVSDSETPKWAGAQQMEVISTRSTTATETPVQSVSTSAEPVVTNERPEGWKPSPVKREAVDAQSARPEGWKPSPKPRVEAGEGTGASGSKNVVLTERPNNQKPSPKPRSEAADASAARSSGSLNIVSRERPEGWSARSEASAPEQTEASTNRRHRADDAAVPAYFQDLKSGGRRHKPETSEAAPSEGGRRRRAEDADVPEYFQNLESGSRHAREETDASANGGRKGSRHSRDESAETPSWFADVKPGSGGRRRLESGDELVEGARHDGSRSSTVTVQELLARNNLAWAPADSSAGGRHRAKEAAPEKAAASTPTPSPTPVRERGFRAGLRRLLDGAKDTTVQQRVGAAALVPAAVVAPLLVPMDSEGSNGPSIAPPPGSDLSSSTVRVLSEYETLKATGRISEDGKTIFLAPSANAPVAQGPVLPQIPQVVPAAPDAIPGHEDEVRGVYEEKLSRAPTDDELEGFEDISDEGASSQVIETVAKALVDGSTEFQSAEATRDAFQSILGRAPSSAELRTYVESKAVVNDVAAPTTAVTKNEVIAALKQTSEARLFALKTDFQKITGSAADENSADFQKLVTEGESLAAQGKTYEEIRATMSQTITNNIQVVSLSELRQIMPRLSPQQAAEYLPHLNAAMREFDINTPRRAASFLAQLAHESAEFRFFEEIASGRAYEGRRDLGNTQAGDGVRFKGRGPIQITGRANYTAASKALGIDLVGNPELAERPDIGFRLAGWYWETRNLNAPADANDFLKVTKRINGGTNGLADRERYWAVSKSVLGA